NALEPVAHGVAVREQPLGGGRHVAVVLEERLHGGQQVGLILLVIRDQRRDRLIVEPLQLSRVLAYGGGEQPGRPPPLQRGPRPAPRSPPRYRPPPPAVQRLRATVPAKPPSDVVSSRSRIDAARASASSPSQGTIAATSAAAPARR